jgi:DNA replication protein DnaC
MPIIVIKSPRSEPGSGKLAVAVRSKNSASAWVIFQSAHWVNFRSALTQWITQHQNILITGPTGVGKSFLACAIGQKACRTGHRVLYQRLPRLLLELEIARGDGRYPRLMSMLSRVDVLLLDDWGLEGGITDRQRRDLLEVLDDRYASRSTIVTSQLPVESWHQHIGDPTLADAILDRLVHNAHRIALDGPSMRRRRGTLQTEKTNTD